MASKKLSTDTSLANSYKLSRGLASVARPSAPTIGTATDGGSGNMSVTFTASTLGPTASSFTLTSSSGVTGSGASSPLTLQEAAVGTYTYSVSGTNANGTGPSSAASNSVNVASVDTSAYFPIQTTTLTTTTSTIVFSSIPNTYTHLQIRGTIATSDANQRSLLIYPNNDQSAIYASHSLFGDGASPYSKNNVSTQWNVLLSDGLYGVAGPTDYWTSFVIDVLDYANTNKYKTTKALMGWDANGSGVVGLGSGLWQSTAAISSLYFINTYASPFRAGSTFTLYGIKG